MAIVHCPTCGKEFDPLQSQAMPFCSDRCRLVDLGRWLDENNRLPIAFRPESGEEQGE
jgi:hypothetical protein